MPAPRDEPPRDALNVRPSGGRAEKGRGLAGRGPENGLEAVRGALLDDELAPDVRGRDELELDDERELAPLLNDFFGSIYCSKRPVLKGFN